MVWNIFIFPYIGNNHPNWLIFFRGVQTTNQSSSRHFPLGNQPCVERSPGYEYMSDSLGRCVLVDHGAMFPEAAINLANARRGVNGFWDLANLWQGYCHLAMVGWLGGWAWGRGFFFGDHRHNFSESPGWSVQVGSIFERLDDVASRFSGWWFGTFFIFPYIGNNHPNWLSYFQRGSNHQPVFVWYEKLEVPQPWNMN